MEREIQRFVQQGCFVANDMQIYEMCGDKIGILYGFDNYNCTLDYLNDIKKEICKDYPNIKDKDIEVWFITPTESNRHARQTMLRVSIPIEDFINFRKENKIFIL